MANSLSAPISSMQKTMASRLPLKRKLGIALAVALMGGAGLGILASVATALLQ